MQFLTISSFQSKLFDSQHWYSSIIPINGKSCKLKVIIRSGIFFCCFYKGNSLFAKTVSYNNVKAKENINIFTVLCC